VWLLHFSALEVVIYPNLQDQQSFEEPNWQFGHQRLGLNNLSEVVGDFYFYF